MKGILYVAAREGRRVITNQRFKGNPGLVVEADGVTVKNCVFLNLKGYKKVPIKTLILADGRLYGGMRGA